MSSGSLDTQRWQQVSALFEQAVELEGAAREAFVARACAGDPALRAALETLLAGDRDAALIDTPLHELVDGRLLETLPAEVGEAGSQLGPYRIDGVLGSGGMGVVYLAHREGDFDQKVAIKRLRQRWDGRLQGERFLQERQILANLSHPYIARLLDGGIDEHGQPWFAMEYVQGEPINRWADARKLDLRARVVLLGEVCEAVQHAHERLVVHRDLKPDNLLVDADGHPKVLDFGVAKLIDPQADSATRTGLAAGFTPEYATPEQISGRPVTAATDVYALGLVLYQLLTGRLPYDLSEHDLPARVRAISQDAPMRPEQALATGQPDEVQQRLRARRTDAHAYRRFVSGDLTRILQTALAKEPERRYATVQAFADDLQRFLDGRPVSVSGDTFGYRARKFVGRNRWGVAMGTLAVLALIGGGIGIVMQSREARAQAERATAEAERANHEAQRAKLEAEGLAAANEFTRQVFTESAPTAAGESLSLAQALDRAVDNMDAENVQTPRAQLHFLLAASGSYESFGQEDKAAEVLRKGLAIQEKRLPDNKDERARLLLRLAFLRMNYEPEQALAWAEEGFALQKANDLASHTATSEAYAMLSGVQYGLEKYEDALTTTREGRAFLLDSGMAEDSDDVLASWSNEAVMLTELERYDEAVQTHRRIIELNTGKHGADSTTTLAERLYLGYTFNISKRFEEGIAELEPARTGLERQLGPDHPLVQLANMQAGRAWLGRKQPQQAAELLGKAHAYGREQEFEGRQAVVAAMYATALARAGECAQARAVMAEAAQRQLTLPGSWAKPLANTPCERAA